MRSLFKGHHRLTPREFNEAWRDCLFALDASVLLNIYRYEAETRDDLFRVLRHLAERIWVPYQAALEFYTNRIAVISEQADKYRELSETVEGTLRRLEDGTFRKSGFLDLPQVATILKPAVEEAIKFIDTRKASHPDLLRNDVFVETLAEIIATRVGKAPTPDEQSSRSAKAQVRIDLKQPPGYEDAKKPVPDRYGDVFIWFELLEKAQTSKKPIAFVTDDEKEDWWQTIRGEKLGARPELRQEMLQEANVEFILYTPARLLEEVGKELKENVKQSSIADAKNVEEQKARQTIHLDPSVLATLFGAARLPGQTVSRKTKALQAATKWVSALYADSPGIVAAPDGHRVEILHRTGKKTVAEIRTFQHAGEQHVRETIALASDRARRSSDTAMLLVLACRSDEAAVRARAIVRRGLTHPPNLEIMVGIVRAGTFVPLERSSSNE